MTKTQARELADIIKDLARSAAYHSDSVYDDRNNLEEKLLEIFPEEVS